MTPKYISASHGEADLSEATERAREAVSKQAIERAEARRSSDRSWDALTAVREGTRQRSGLAVSRSGNITQKFACNCGKHSHGHGSADHNQFGGIVQPTLFEAEAPAWVEAYEESAKHHAEGEALQQRVKQARGRGRELGSTNPREDRR